MIRHSTSTCRSAGSAGNLRVPTGRATRAPVGARFARCEGLGCYPGLPPFCRPALRLGVTEYGTARSLGQFPPVARRVRGSAVISAEVDLGQAGGHTRPLSQPPAPPDHRARSNAMTPSNGFNSAAALDLPDQARPKLTRVPLRHPPSIAEASTSREASIPARLRCSRSRELAWSARRARSLPPVRRRWPTPARPHQATLLHQLDRQQRSTQESSLYCSGTSKHEWPCV